jgi:hypothetical protein
MRLIVSLVIAGLLAVVLWGTPTLLIGLLSLNGRMAAGFVGWFTDSLAYTTLAGLGLVQWALLVVEVWLVAGILAAIVCAFTSRGLGYAAGSVWQRMTLSSISMFVAVVASVIMPVYVVRVLWGGIPDIGLTPINPPIITHKDGAWVGEVLALYLLALAMPFVFRDILPRKWGWFNIGTSFINGTLVWSAVVYYYLFTDLLRLAHYEITPYKLDVMWVLGPGTLFDMIFGYMGLIFLSRAIIGSGIGAETETVVGGHHR